MQSAAVIISKSPFVDIQGQKQGHWKKIYENGKTAYEGYFVNDKPVGEFMRYHENGKVEAVLLYDNIGHKAKATIYWNNTRKYAEGNYIDQKRDSTWKFYSYEGFLVAQEEYSMGAKNGKSITYFRDQKPSQITEYENDKKNGEWKVFYDNGELKTEGNYTNDLRSGKIAVYLPGGRPKYVGAYSNDARDSVWTFYKTMGGIDAIIEYKDGVQLDTNANRNDLEYFMKTIEDTGKEELTPQDFLNRGNQDRRR